MSRECEVAKHCVHCREPKREVWCPASCPLLPALFSSRLYPAGCVIHWGRGRLSSVKAYTLAHPTVCLLGDSKPIALTVKTNHLSSQLEDETPASPFPSKTHRLWHPSPIQRRIACDTTSPPFKDASLVTPLPQTSTIYLMPCWEASLYYTGL